jgi:hypothetical protein
MFLVMTDAGALGYPFVHPPCWYTYCTCQQPPWCPLSNLHTLTHPPHPQVTFSGGSEFPAKVIGVDQDKDIAVLEVREPPPMPAAAEGEGDDAAALVGVDVGRCGLFEVWLQLPRAGCFLSLPAFHLLPYNSKAGTHLLSLARRRLLCPHTLKPQCDDVCGCPRPFQC